MDPPATPSGLSASAQGPLKASVILEKSTSHALIGAGLWVDIDIEFYSPFVYLVDLVDLVIRSRDRSKPSPASFLRCMSTRTSSANVSIAVRLTAYDFGSFSFEDEGEDEDAFGADAASACFGVSFACANQSRTMKDCGIIRIYSSLMRYDDRWWECPSRGIEHRHHDAVIRMNFESQITCDHEHGRSLNEANRSRGGLRGL